MVKVVNPCVCTVYGFASPAPAFVKIEYTNQRLSLTGVIGPKHGGNCRGGAGQICGEIRKGIPADGWNEDMLMKLCDIWDEWHLNDCRPYCQHQKELGWDKQASEQVHLYHWKLTSAALRKKEDAENAAIAALKAGVTHTPTEEETKYANLEYFVETYGHFGDESIASYYEPANSPSHRSVEIKTRGWIRHNESELGILCKPCPVCGYKYGSAWITEEVPADVIDWLFSLPDTKITPAWV